MGKAVSFSAVARGYYFKVWNALMAIYPSLSLVLRVNGHTTRVVV